MTEDLTSSQSPPAANGGISAFFSLLAAGLNSPPASPISANGLSVGQPSVEELAELGIKVRDYIHDNPLPKIPSYRPTQIQPGLASYKRAGQDEEENSQGSSKRQRLTLQRTEPVIRPNALSRARGFVNINNSFDSNEHEQHGFSQQTDSPPSPQSQLPQLGFIDSQDSDEYINTPLVTPHGSLQWNVTDTSAIPASQLDEVLQPEAPEPLSYSQLGFSPTLQRDVTPVREAPLLGLSTAPCEFPVIDEEDEDDDELILPVAPQPPPRYHFRKRPPALQSPTPKPKPPSSRSKFSVQSAQLGSPTVKVTNSRHKRSRGGVLSGEKGVII
ncbi:hypothetical protein C8J56DRAFT_989366 [Mycena floridula]|nr:hypothetical protein C8J56DRAFT_989366 [Mycena floridula]